MSEVLCDGRLVKNFSLEEMANNLSKQPIKLIITPWLVRQAIMMQELRDWWARPMEVSSWYRDEEFNRSVGGDRHSCHLDGIATDIIFRNLSTEQRRNLINRWKKICMKHGVIGGVSIYDWGLHFDSNNNPDRYGKHNKSFRITDFRR